MSQRMKKQAFKIMPVSVAVLMVIAVSVGVWQNWSAINADASVANDWTFIEPGT